ncbi:cation transporter [Mangrovibacter phragmitis]|uniref:cation transporter n=1 Tax=Mangrovibacter phragmitis TaxID=1691903 RepID=UPI00336A1CB5
MSSITHQSGANDVNRVTRKLKLSGVSEDQADALVSEIRQLAGMETVEYSSASASLTFVYDAAQCSVDAVEKVLDRLGAQFAASAWNRVKMGYFRFTDKNIKDNAAHRPHCCNKIPRR